jgi:hypothetical protein
VDVPSREVIIGSLIDDKKKCRVCVYPRSLGSFKSTVRNKVALEGCIAEGYIATELVTFCSKYLDNAPTVHNRPQRNPDGSKGPSTRVTLNRLTMH